MSVRLLGLRSSLIIIMNICITEATILRRCGMILGEYALLTIVVRIATKRGSRWIRSLTKQILRCTISTTVVTKLRIVPRTILIQDARIILVFWLSSTNPPPEKNGILKVTPSGLLAIKRYFCNITVLEMPIRFFLCLSKKHYEL